MKLFQTLAEGGQTWAHRVRMVRQVIKIALIFSLLSALAYFCYAFAYLDPVLLPSGYYYLKAKSCSYLSLPTVSVAANFWEKIAHERISSPEKKISPNRLKSLTQKKVNILIYETKKTAIQATILALVTFAALLLFFLARGPPLNENNIFQVKEEYTQYCCIFKLFFVEKHQISKLAIFL